MAEDERASRGRVRVLVVALVAMAVITFVWAMSRGNGPATGGGDAHAPDAGAPTAPPPGDPLAPTGYVPSDLDPVPGLTLRLGLVHPTGGARLCEIGEAGDVVAPALERAVCRDASREETRPLAPARTELDAGDVVVTVERANGVSAGDRLVVTPRAGGAPLVTELPFVIERVRGCRSAEALALVAEAPVEHDEREVAVLFHGSAGLSAPIRATAQIDDQTFTCRGDEATLSWIEPVRETQILMVHQLRFRAGRHDDTISRLTIAGSDPIVADLAGKLLVVWSATDGTRMRLAPITELGQAADIVGTHDPRLRVHARRLFVRGGTAVLVLRTPDGAYGLRIDAMGNVTPLPAATASDGSPIPAP